MTSKTPSLTTSSEPIQLDSPARIALAIRLLQTKPRSLSVSEFFTLLRSHTVPGGRTLNNASERRHIEACEFWRKRSEADSRKVLELQAKVNELTGKSAALTKTSKVSNKTQTSSKSSEIISQPHDEGPVKKKGRATNKKGDPGKVVKRVENQVGAHRKKGQQQETLKPEEIGISGEIFAPFSGSTVSDLISSLNLLQFTREPHLIAKSISQTSQALCAVIQDFIDGKHSKAIPSARLTRGAAGTQTKKSKEIADFSGVAEKSCIKVFSALECLASSLREGDKTIGVQNKGFLADGIGAVIKMLTGVISLIHKNTRALLSAALYPQFSPGELVIKDIRLELTMVLIRLLKSLNTETSYQRNILEGTFHYFLEIIGGLLSHAFTSTSDKGGGDIALLEKLAMEETSWYFLRIFESMLQITNCPSNIGEGKLEKISIERLKHALIDDLFNSKRDGDDDEGEMRRGRKRKRDIKEGFWGCLEVNKQDRDFLVVESPLSRVLWELLGLDVLTS